MKISPSICIDPGAAFTKIAIRVHPKETSILLGDPGQVGDYQICIPSLALHRVSTNSWLFGWELLDLDPKNYAGSDDIHIYQNWKSSLFMEEAGELEPDTAVAADPRIKAITCCREFLTALGQELIPLMIGLHPQFRELKVSDFETFICVPEFVIDSKAGNMIEQIMADAGFKNRGKFCISEPKSSLIGVLTEGQNYVNDDGTPNINYMFREVDLLEKLTSGCDSVFFVDIGAFTTDLALTNLDCKGEKLIDSPAASFPFGVFKLDEMTENALGPEVADLLANSEASFREHYHRICYGSLEGEGIILRDGTELSHSIIAKCIDEFTDSILNACENFLETHKTGNIDIAVLTGGGTICPKIANRIAEGLSKFDIAVIRAHEGANVTKLDPVSSEIVRGSSAIGGTSILYALKCSKMRF